MNSFFNYLRLKAKEISEAKQKYRKLSISEADHQTLCETSVSCVICRKKLSAKKVIHHDHATGQIYGMAHNECNLKLRTQSFTPVLLHNLSKYDAHHLIRSLKLNPKVKLTVVSCTDEIYISFSLHVPIGDYKSKSGAIYPKFEEMRFLDSYRFLPSSLNNFVNSMNENDFRILDHHFKKPDESNLLKKKGFYPYSYIDCYQKFEEKQLPVYGPNWFNTLSGKINVNTSDLANANNVWKKFRCENIADYHDIYLKSDVLLLADIFESFRNLFKKNFDLDPCHYYNSPNISWDAMLKTTGIELDLYRQTSICCYFARAPYEEG